MRIGRCIYTAIANNEPAQLTPPTPLTPKAIEVLIGHGHIREVAPNRYEVNFPVPDDKYLARELLLKERRRPAGTVRKHVIPSRPFAILIIPPIPTEETST